MSELKLKLETPEKGISILRLEGEFENLAILNAKEELMGYLESSAGSSLLLDFSTIQYIDSAGIGVLIEMAKKASQKKIKFSVLNANEQVKKVIEITHTDKIVTLL